MIKLIVLLLILLMSLQKSLWFGKNGIFDFIYIKNNNKIKKTINKQLKIRNVKLIQEIKSLKYDKEVIEEYSRNKLNMIKNNEIFYRILQK